MGKLRHNINLMITFLVSGLWHGANWTFIFWGGLHGAALVAESNWNRSRGKTGAVPAAGFRWLFKVFLVFVFCSFAWIFFRAGSMSDAIYMITHAFTGVIEPVNYLRMGFVDLGITKEKLLLFMINLGILCIFDFLSLKKDVITVIGALRMPIRWLMYYGIIMWIIFMFPDAGNQFVYFQF